MRETRRTQPRLEALESKNLLNGAGVNPGGPISFDGLPTGHHQPGLTGQIRGTVTTSLANPDIGHSQTLEGAGRIASLGPVVASGTSAETGFIRQGHATGTLTIKGVPGSVTLNLVGPQQSGFSGVPSNFTYRVTSSSGEVQSLASHGTLTLNETAGTFPGTFSLTIHPAR